jgi:hypothetical protein
LNKGENVANRRNPKRRGVKQLFDKLQSDPELRQQARRDLAPVVEGLDPAMRTALAGHRKSDWLKAIDQSGLAQPAAGAAATITTPRNNVFNVYLRDAAPPCGHDDCADFVKRCWAVTSPKFQ